MFKIKDLLHEEWITMELFWKTIEDIPDNHEWGKHKKNIKALFKKDGTPKVKALSPQSQEDYQTLHSTSIFIRKMLRHKIHMDRRKKRREMMLQNIQNVKEGKDVPRRITADLKIEEPRKDKMHRRLKESKNDQRKD